MHYQQQIPTSLHILGSKHLHILWCLSAVEEVESIQQLLAMLKYNMPTEKHMTFVSKRATSFKKQQDLYA